MNLIVLCIYNIYFLGAFFEFTIHYKYIRYLLPNFGKVRQAKSVEYWRKKYR